MVPDTSPCPFCDGPVTPDPLSEIERCPACGWWSDEAAKPAAARTWLVHGTMRQSGLPASVTVRASRDVLTTAAELYPWFRPVQARSLWGRV